MMTKADSRIASQPIQLEDDGSWGLSGNLKGKSNPRFRYFGGMLKYGAENGTKKGKIKVLTYFETKTGESKNKVIGEIIFTHDRYLPNFLGNASPEIVIYRDLERITHSMMILLYPGNRAVINGYMEKYLRDEYCK